MRPHYQAELLLLCSRPCRCQVWPSVQNYDRPLPKLSTHYTQQGSAWKPLATSALQTPLPPPFVFFLPLWWSGCVGGLGCAAAAVLKVRGSVRGRVEMSGCRESEMFSPLTSGDVLFQQLYLQVKDLLLEVAQRVFHFLPPRHHVAQVPHLKHTGVSQISQLNQYLSSVFSSRGNMDDLLASLIRSCKQAVSSGFKHTFRAFLLLQWEKQKKLRQYMSFGRYFEDKV